MAFDWALLGMNAANTLLGAGSSFFQSKLNERAITQQNRYNMDMAKYQNSYNTEMWEKQNAYNSPEQTMKRLVDAGINPRAYQQIGQFANADAPAQAAEVNKVAEMSAYQNVVRQSLENSLLRQEVRLKREQVNKVSGESELNKTLKSLNDLRANVERNKVLRSYYDTELSYFQAIVYLAENGFGDEAMEGLRHYLSKDGKVIPVSQVYTNLQKMLDTFNERYDAKVESEKFLSLIRKFEALSKKESYRFLKKYGLSDNDTDGVTTAIRFIFRALELNEE